MTLIWKVIRKLGAFVYPPLTYSRLSFSQDGEDLMLLSFFEEFPKDYKGFYVDIGAHHPFRFSNTLVFYELGWRGINLDAMPGSMTPFRKHRGRDINLESAVGSNEKPLTFYCFNEPALNTFDEELAVSRNGKNGYRLTSTVSVPVRSLEKILDEHLPAGTVIDFLSVDVEGLDYEVLSSNNWKKYRPRFILAETLYTEKSDRSVQALLTANGYELAGNTFRNSLYKLAL